MILNNGFWSPVNGIHRHELKHGLPFSYTWPICLDFESDDYADLAGCEVSIVARHAKTGALLLSTPWSTTSGHITLGTATDQHGQTYTPNITLNLSGSDISALPVTGKDDLENYYNYWIRAKYPVGVAGKEGLGQERNFGGGGFYVLEA